MVVYRISKAKYAKRLEASGRSNRWNRAGEFVVYASASRALAILELLAHRNAIMPTVPYRMIEITLEEKWITDISARLPKKWSQMGQMHRMQALGSVWYQQSKSLVLRVPSALVKAEHNYIINTMHPDFQKIKPIKTEPFSWDARLV